MLKTVGKFLWRMCKCVVGAVVVCFASYYLSLGLNWFTDLILKHLETVVTYLKGNWVAMLVAMLALVIGGICFDAIESLFRRKTASKKRNTVDYEE